MTRRPKAVCGYVAGWLLVISFVVLLTVIFSFLGTIICAALAGMMMGAARSSRWQSLAVSLVFPGVIAAVLRVTKAELPASQVLFVSSLCFAIFWVIHLGMTALISQEKKQPITTAQSSSGGERIAAVRQASPRFAFQPGQRGERVLPGPMELTLEVLQGNWFAHNPGPGPMHSRKALEISQNTLVLSLTDASGHVRSSAKAHLRIGPGPVLALDPHPAPACLDPEAQVSI